MTLQNISYIPLEVAARKYGISKKVLRQRVSFGKLEAIETVNGDLLVADNIDPSLMNIKREDFEHLRGQEISMSEASRKYSTPEINITHQNFSRWAKAGSSWLWRRGCPGTWAANCSWPREKNRSSPINRSCPAHQSWGRWPCPPSTRLPPSWQLGHATTN